ncbi:hypothetical protein THOG05_20142 [Vibrio rotiferianus]|mgnify:CR=1 FL=1|nr:hypothetical protein THOG05_20142 [Vibrio rotiferianus]
MLVGYERASSSDLSLDIQVEQLKKLGCEKIFQENASAKGPRLVFHDLGNIDINSDVGRVIYTIIFAFAEMERKRILQRCNEGRERAKAEGKYLG